MKKIIFTSLLILSSTMWAKGGDGAGNGGGGWVCQNHDKSIRKIELVDFYEIEKEFDLTLDRFLGLSKEEILEKYKTRINKINPRLYSALVPYFESLKSKLRFRDTALEIIDDRLFRVKPPQKWCAKGVISYQQLANFTDYGDILLDKDLFYHKKFSELERAGLFLHEVVYEYLRNTRGDKSSVRTRKIVGIIASTVDIRTAAEKLSRQFGSNLIFQVF